MPFIADIREKERALEEVETLLKNIKKTNSFINSGYKGKEFKVSFYVPNDDYGQTTETNILCEKKCILDEMALDYKKLLVTRVKELMSVYGIVLTCEDLEIIK